MNNKLLKPLFFSKEMENAKKSIPAGQSILTNRKKTLSFQQKLFLSYFLLIATCVSIMGLSSHGLIAKNITEHTIISNNDILNRFSSTVDTFILGSIDKLSLTILQDSLQNPYVSYYFTNSLDGKVVDTIKIFDYLKSLKAVNPMIQQISIYYAGNSLLVSSEYIKYPDNKRSPDIEEIEHIKQLASATANKGWVNEVVQVPTDPASSTQSAPQTLYLLTFIRKIPVFGNSNPENCITISVSEELLHDAIISSTPTDFGTIFIVDGQGTIISHSDKNFLNTNINSLDYGAKIMEADKRTGYFKTEVTGVSCVVSYSSSEYNNWKYIAVKPIAGYSETSRFLLQTIIIIAVLTLAVGLLVSAFPSMKFNKPLKKLVDNCKNTVRTASAHHQPGGDEYSIIGSALDTLSDRISAQESKIHGSYPILMHYFILSLVNQNYTDDGELDEKMGLLELKLPYENFMAVVLKLKKSDFNFNVKLYEFAKLTITEMLENKLSNENVKCISTQDSNQIIAILNFKGAAPAVVKKVAASVQAIESNIQVKLYTGLGNSVNSLALLHESHTDAVLCIKYSYVYPEKYIFCMDEVSIWEQNNGKSAEAVIDEFANALNSQNSILALQTTNKLFNTIKEMQCSYSCVMDALLKAVTHLEHFMETVKIEADDITIDNMHSQINRAGNINDLEIQFYDIINKIFDYIENRHSNKNKELVEKSKNIIALNIGRQDLSLNVVADLLYISPGYLSQLFKNETGMNFITYVMNFRLEKAKEMILTTNLKVEKIAQLNGYSSSQYFIKRFKRKYGFSPREYKAFCGEQAVCPDTGVAGEIPAD